MRTFFIVIALILFGILIGVLAAKYVPMSSTTVTPTPISTPTIIAVPTASPSAVLDETANWLSYSNSLLQYSIKYPSPWKVLDLSQGTQIEIYYQPEITKSVGAILIEETAQAPRDISRYVDSKTIGNLTAKCMSNELSKTWCYLENGETIKLSIMITEDQDETYNLTLDKILSTFKFMDSTSANYTCPASGWVDCMPILDDAKTIACSAEAMTWYKANCPNFQGAAL